jgi:hypothetical protein
MTSVTFYMNGKVVTRQQVQQVKGALYVLSTTEVVPGRAKQGPSWCNVLERGNIQWTVSQVQQLLTGKTLQW